MKGISKKLAVFVIITVIAMFSAAAMAWDDYPKWKHGIHGHYTVTGAGHNLVSTTGFNNDYSPIECPSNGNPPFGCAVLQDIQILSGDLTFNKDGTGSFKQLNRGISTPPLGYNLKTGYYEFIYTMTSERTFTYQVKPGTYMEVVWLAGGQTGQTLNFEVDGHCEGVLSRDLQNVIVTCGPTTSALDFILTAYDISTTPPTKLPIQGIFSQSLAGIAVKE